MATPLKQLQTSIVDLAEEDRELSADELPLIVGGGELTGYGAQRDETATYTLSDARHMN
jgi:hypothetical protein